MDDNNELPTLAEHDSNDRRPSKDPFLAILVNSVDQTLGWEIGITLHVSGVIISGLLCSITTFLEEQAEMIRRLGTEETAEARQGFAEIFDQLAKETRAQAGAEHDEDGEVAKVGADLPDFIHLRAATVHAPGTDAFLPETLWRGRLEHVSGWSLGNFGPKPPPRASAGRREQISV